MRPQPGMTLTLQEQEYKFGIGPLLCKVHEVIEEVHFDGEPWWRVRGECANGTAARHGGWIERELYVIGSAVRSRSPGTRTGQP